ncbi:hypothetical protein MSP8887_03727 [Marinomonas spartinae]|uniref:DUF1501 domain-containing protein n=1 Tax=Marinomonas spartinae TaxID=1792290 RepID=A0A1A8TIS0_9GAMM|nr:DUF1501 domain-containing protein [Marinomonas spartinae]SBS33595.1 hypothetical protein MSP8886_02809 [Marinomonas spartinae]SBS39243.1 hypothetical protein MSP8887_03727 [Marinomonas spartinae]
MKMENKKINTFDIKRRKLLRNSFLGMCSLPFSSSVFAGLSSSSDDSILGKKRVIVYELNGGNDGLSTIIPYNDSLYKKFRPTLALGRDEVIPLNSDIALSNNLSYMSQLFKDNDVAIIQDVGYPNPDLSHFVSRAIWDSGKPAKANSDATGWYGDLVVQNRSAFQEANLDVDALCFESHAAFTNGEGVTSLNTKNIAEFLKSDFVEPNANTNSSSAQQYLYSLMEKNKQVRLRLLSRLNNKLPKWSGYDTPLNRNIEMVNWFIKEGVKTPIYKIAQSGFDTHSNQKNTHIHLMKTLNQSLEMLVTSLKKSSEWNNTIILVRSEFGRRVEENGGRGTDHGTSGPVFLIGGSVNGGVYGKRAALDDLDGNGNLKYTTDFRQVYSTIASNFFELKNNVFLKQGFETIGFI